MTLDQEQRWIVWQSGAAVLLAAAVLAAGWIWLPPELVGLGDSAAAGDGIGYALRWELPVFLWLAGCVGAVSQGRFWAAADRKGSAYGGPTTAIAVRAANLQNTLEQTVLAVGGHLILAELLRGPELVLIPLLVFLYLLGRMAFAAGYAINPIARGFGMALTGAPIGFAYVLAAVLILSGR